MSPRVAIYAAPGTGSTHPTGVRLRERAEAWLGRSAAGDPIPPELPAGWTREAVDAITLDARRYGFHGTLKAPFRLAAGRTLGELDAAVAGYAARRAAVTVPRLSLARIDRFLALVPGADATALHALADEVVTGFDGFRAPATDAELARRDPASLTARQREHLAELGYPYVLDEFRFHLTLTDRVPVERGAEVQATLRAWFSEVLGRDAPIDALALFTEAEPGAPFVVHSIHRLLAPPGRTAGLRASRALTR